MKIKSLIFLSFLSIQPLMAVSFDAETFGASLNGWDKKRTANYTFTEATYRTHAPAITPTPSRGIFLSMQVDLRSGMGNAAVCHLHLTFSSAGILESAQIKGLVGKRNIDTGLIRRPEAPVAPPVAEGAAAVPVKPFHATDELVAELFTSFDGEMKRINAAAEGEKKDLLSRLSGKPAFDLGAGLRHNLNLVLQNVRR
jgi:hypothetical protein